MLQKRIMWHRNIDSLPKIAHIKNDTGHKIQSFGLRALPLLDCFYEVVLESFFEKQLFLSYKTPQIRKQISKKSSSFQSSIYDSLLHTHASHLTSATKNR